MFAAMAISAFLVTANILVHYEALRLMSVHVPSLPIAVRLKVLTVVLGCLLGFQGYDGHFRKHNPALLDRIIAASPRCK